MMLGRGLVLDFDCWVARILHPFGLHCIALHTVAPGRVVCHAWFVFWVRQVLSSRVVLQHVPPTSVFCGCVWYEAGLRSCHFMSRHVVSKIMSCHAMSCHVTSRHVKSCPVISARVMFGSSSGILSRPFFSCHVTSSRHKQ